MKILFLPLFKMPSGHHRVADALIGIIKNRTNKVTCVKVDLLSYSNEALEKVVSGTYLKWIGHTPETYDWAYKHFAYTKKHDHRSFKGLEHYFLRKLLKLLEEERPDMVVCTHGFPSLLMSRLKNKGMVHIPVVNVYTDFFINDIWGRTGIDYHLVPNLSTKKQMVEKYGISDKNIYVTGIPIHEIFFGSAPKKESADVKNILVAGGSSGLGNIIGLVKHANPDFKFRYTVLCGKNEKLYQELKGLQDSSIEALPYIASRDAMDDLYNRMDAIITKPGGVTVSEALRKRIPIFVHSALPGQEDINLQYLTENHLVYLLKADSHFEEQIARVLHDDLERRKWERAVDKYFSEIQMDSANLLYDFLMTNVIEGVELNRKSENVITKHGFVSKIKKYAKKMSISSNA
ncbi:MAG: MGDG synthase family glycosyltransferase [Tuberibacillus sp.]